MLTIAYCRVSTEEQAAEGFSIEGQAEKLRAYAELHAQWGGNDAKLTGPAGRPGPELVGHAVADALENPATPLRVEVGADAALVLELRRTLSDQEFEATMRQALDLTW